MASIKWVSPFKHSREEISNVFGVINNLQTILNGKITELVDCITNQSDLLNRKLNEAAEGVSNQAGTLGQRFDQLGEGINNQADQLYRKLGEMVERIVDQSGALGRKFDQLGEGINNQSDLLNRKLTEVAEGISNLSDLLNRKLGGVTDEVGNQSSMLGRKLDQVEAGINNQSDLLNRKLGDVAEGVGNQSGALGRKFDQLSEGLDNQSDLLNRKLGELTEEVGNQSSLLGQKFDRLSDGLNNQSTVMNQAIVQLLEGIDNQTELLNRKFEQLFEGENNQSDLINRKFEQLLEAVSRQSDTLNSRLGELIGEAGTHGSLLRRALPRSLSGPPSPPAAKEASFNHATANNAAAGSFRDIMQRAPLLIDDLTYNTNHPDYDARLVRNYSGKLFNRHGPCTSFVYAELLRLAKGDEVPDAAWDDILSRTLDEVRAIPGADQVFERRGFIESYVANLGQKYDAVYEPGWVNLHDAVFLYWLVRQTRPDKIVQCGACNGLSSAFMMLGMVQNGPEGTLSIIDLPPIFNAENPEWTENGKAYGVCIPAGKTTAWMVPDMYRERLEIRNGDAKDLLRPLIDELASVDFFFHDSDHTYRHMMFEFEQAKRKLSRGGVIVADDVSWNASLWDFADKFGSPAYNFKGTIGVTFF